MLPEYVGEEVPGNQVWGTAVTYLNAAQRAPYALIFQNGKIFDAKMKPFDTKGAETLWSDQGRAIFVMDANGNFYASDDQRRGEFHHSSLVAGEPVAAAGEIEVDNGVLTAISDKSGHYRPSRICTAQAIERLIENNTSCKTVMLDLV